MQIEITGEAEQLIQAALASGKFASAQEYIAAMAKSTNGVCDVSDSYVAQSVVAGLAGWDDPEMDEYNNYDAHKRPS